MINDDDIKEKKAHTHTQKSSRKGQISRKTRKRKSLHDDKRERNTRGKTMGLEIREEVDGERRGVKRESRVQDK